MSNKERKDAFTVKVSIPNDLLPSIDAAAKQANLFRSHWILDACKNQLVGSSQSSSALDPAKYPDAIREVLKVADGRLTRIQAEHVTAKVIATLGS